MALVNILRTMLRRIPLDGIYEFWVFAPFIIASTNTVDLTNNDNKVDSQIADLLIQVPGSPT